MERSESGQGRLRDACEAKNVGAAWERWSASSGELLVGGGRRSEAMIACSVKIVSSVCLAVLYSFLLARAVWMIREVGPRLEDWSLGSLTGI